MSKPRYTPEQMCEALARSRGVQVVAAKALRCSRGTIRRYISLYPEVRRVYDEARNTFVDMAEVQLMAAVDEGEWPAVRFTLITLGKDRGYVVGGPVRPEDEDDQEIDEFEEALVRVFGSADGGGGDAEAAETVDAAAAAEEDETADDGREVLDAGWKTMDLLNIGTGETASEGRP